MTKEVHCKIGEALADKAQLAEHRPEDWKVTGLWDRSPFGCMWETTDRCFSLSPSFPLSLKINKIFTKEHMKIIYILGHVHTHRVICHELESFKLWGINRRPASAFLQSFHLCMHSFSQYLLNYGRHSSNGDLIENNYFHRSLESSGKT